MSLVKGATWVLAEDGLGGRVKHFGPDTLPDGRPKIVGKGYFGAVVVPPERIIVVAHYDPVTSKDIKS